MLWKATQFRRNSLYDIHYNVGWREHRTDRTVHTVIHYFSDTETFSAETLSAETLKKSCFSFANKLTRVDQSAKISLPNYTLLHTSDKWWSHHLQRTELRILLTFFRFLAGNSYTLRFFMNILEDYYLSLIHIWRCRRSTLCRSRWSPYH